MDEKLQKIILGYLGFIVVMCLLGIGASFIDGPALYKAGEAEKPAAEATEKPAEKPATP